ncbi:glycosyltransferase family 2 protein [Cohnella sp. GCM10027633]|uniref:glycosyltransferase family 2 protein n=1 Tax=unclassified Cohnella TaxID=2636738 RepID=UPI00363C9D85
MHARTPDLVSIVVTNYNNGKFIGECLDSLLRQSYPGWEIVWVDDGSTDDSRRRLDEWFELNGIARQDDRFCVLELPRNVGYAGAVTAGLFLAKGEFIAMHDSDDVSHSHRLAKQTAYLRDHPDIELVGTNYAVFTASEGLARPDKLQTAKWLGYGAEQIRGVYAKGGHCVSHGTVMIRGALFDRLGGHTRRVEGAEDYEFVARCLDRTGNNVDNMRDVLYYYRLHPDQRSRLYFGSKKPANDER